MIALSQSEILALAMFCSAVIGFILGLWLNLSKENKNENYTKPNDKHR